MDKKNNIDASPSSGKKQKTSEKRISSKNKYARKRGGIAFAFTALFIVVVIALNILVTALTDRFPLDIDLTSDLRYTLSEENVDYIKTIDKKITVYVAGTEESYVSDVTNYALNYLGTYDNSGYFDQTLYLIKEYAKYNDNISIVFLDVYGNEFNDIQKNYSGYTFGDLFVESTFTVDGKDITRRKLVSFKDMYYSETSSNGYYSYIKSSMLEDALTSAIYSVTLEKTVKIGYLSDYCSDAESFTEYISSTLEKNNYELVPVSGFGITEIPSDLDALMLFELSSDLSDETITAISDFLKNGGDLQKNLYYFPSYDTVERPNINEFLEEWGISYYSENNVYQMIYDKDLQDDDPTGIFMNMAELKSLNSSYTKTSDDASGVVICKNALAMERVYETYLSRTATTVYGSYDSYLKPAKSSDSWKPESGAVSASYAAVIVTTENNADNKTSSSVVGFASSGFLSNDLINSPKYTSFFKNDDVFLDILNKTCNQSGAPFSFKLRTITPNTFIADGTAALVFKIVFVFILPIALAATGVVVWIRRKNR